MIRLFQSVILVLFLSLIALGSAIVTMRFAIHGAEVTIPSFKALTTQEAMSKAADLGVEMTIDNRFYSAEVPAGRILNQSPAPGTVVRREWHVRAVESLGPQLVAIPNLVGQPQRAATIQLRRLGLDLGAVARMPLAAAEPHAADFPPDTVIAQDPGAGAAGVEKPSVALVVSDLLPAPVAAFVMPDLTGQQYATAAATITRAGLTLGSAIESPVMITTEGQVVLPPGSVVGQTPLAGYSVDANVPVQLTVVR
jgi:beta-lactam-binding protein with PASTA domain